MTESFRRTIAAAHENNRRLKEAKFFLRQYKQALATKKNEVRLAELQLKQMNQTIKTIQLAVNAQNAEIESMREIPINAIVHPNNTQAEQ